MSGDVGYGLASKLRLPQRLKAAIEGVRASQGLLEEDSPWRPPSFPHQAARWHIFWVEFHRGYFRRCWAGKLTHTSQRAQPHATVPVYR